MMRIFLFALFPVWAVIGMAFAQDIDESALFSDTSSVTPAEAIVSDTAVIAPEKKSVGISGEITSAAMGGVGRDWSSIPDASLSTIIVGNLLLDVRLPQGIKGFANMEAAYIPDSTNYLIALRELFVDFNLGRRAYLRTGKQVLQWGRCFFWNPTDLINVERKLFIQKIGYREGAYGLRLHVPFGTRYNFYTFVDTHTGGDPENVAVATKFEFLLGRTEMALAYWGRKGYSGVTGFDFSTRFWDIQWAGEAAISSGDNFPVLVASGDTLHARKRSDEWNTRLCLSGTRLFDWGNWNDRLSVTAEFYYNQNGFSENVFSDSSQFFYGSSGQRGDKKTFLLMNNLYEMNNLSKAYMAVFSGFNRFLLSDMTLNLNAIGNLVDHSAILTAGLSYRNLNDLVLGVSVSGFLGEDDTEYALSGNSLSLQLTAGILF